MPIVQNYDKDDVVVNHAKEEFAFTILDHLDRRFSTNENTTFTHEDMRFIETLLNFDESWTQGLVQDIVETTNINYKQLFEKMQNRLIKAESDSVKRKVLLLMMYKTEQHYDSDFINDPKFRVAGDLIYAISKYFLYKKDNDRLKILQLNNQLRYKIKEELIKDIQDDPRVEPKKILLRAILAMFIGIFLRLIVENRSVTEPI